MKKETAAVFYLYCLLLLSGFANGNESNTVKCLICNCFKTERGLTADCSDRNLTGVPQLPKEVQVLLLNNNTISTIKNSSFDVFTNLTVLDISNNNITSIEEGAFDSLHLLEILNLDNCFSSYRDILLNSSFFKPLKKLRTISLRTQRRQYNTSDVYPTSALRYLEFLEVLHIDGLPTGTFDDEFRLLTKLTNLSVSGHTGFCDISELTNSTFFNVPCIENLNVSKCKLQRIDKEALRCLRNIQTLDLSQNTCLNIEGIENATYGLRNSPRIKALYLNEIVDIFVSCVNIGDDLFKNLQNTSLKEIHLDRNRIETFSEGGIQIVPNTLEKVSLRVNRFTYGVYLLHFEALRGLKVLDLSGDQHFPTEFNHFETCNPTYGPSNSCSCLSSSVTSVAYSKLFRHLNTANITFPPNLTDLTLQYRHLPYVIKEVSFKTNSLKHLQLSYNLFTDWYGPVYGLEGLHYLDLSVNDVSNVSNRFFRNFPSLQSLNISHNTLQYSLQWDEEGEIFEGLSKLRTLDMSYNYIQKLSPSVFKGLPSLEILNLSHNFLREFNSNIIDMKGLHTIDCTYNEIRWIRLTIRQQFDSLARDHNITLQLAHNTFDCTCENLLFLTWLKDSKLLLGDKRNYKCMYNSGNINPLVQLEEILEGLQKECNNHLGLYIGMTSTTVVVLGLIMVSIGYRFRWKLRYWYYAARLQYVTTNNIEHDYFEYDAFISYADEDRDFVVSELIEKLETEAGLRLNIHQRNFTAGRPIASNIIEAVKNSRKTLLILSEHFIQSYWCTYELQMANMESVTTGRDVILVLRLGHAHTKDIPAEIIYHFHTNSYIEYPHGEDRDLFWRTLINALKT